MSKPKARRQWPRTVLSAAHGGKKRIARPHGDASDFPSHELYLKRIALRLTGEEMQAEQLVQATQRWARENLDQFTGGTCTTTRLVTILTRIHLAYVNPDAAATKAMATDRSTRPITAEIEPDIDATIPNIRDANLCRAVRALDPELRAVVECCYLGRSTYQEAADRLGIRVGDVETRLKRARDRLKELLTSETS
jgi:RNA polymerase sigma-70 factor (ECF subfamily)